jgi:translation elongation factor P/translation initiation factor 5A
MPKRNDTSPAKRFFANGVSCSIFSRTIKKDGKDSVFYSVQVSRSFTDKNGERSYTSSLDERDMLIASSMLERAYWWIAEQREARASSATKKES